MLFNMTRLYDPDNPNQPSGGNPDPNANPNPTPISHLNDNPSGDGNSGGEDDLAARISAEVQRATAGLRSNRDEILEEKRELQENYQNLSNQIEALGGSEGIKSLIETRKQLMADEVNRLLADGKHEEWFEARVSPMRQDFEQQLAARDAKILELTKGHDEAVQAKIDLIFRTEMQRICTAEGIEPSAFEDALNRAQKVLVYDDESGKLIHKGVMGKDGSHPQTASEWLQGMRADCRHWWPPSQGAGANGNVGSADETSDEALGSMSMDEYKKARANRGMGSGYPTARAGF